MSAEAEEGFPWYVKAMIALTILVIIAIVVIDLLEFAGAV
jgi:hypothetical protein